MATKANKTIETKESIAVYLTRIKDEKKRKDCAAIIDLIKKQTGIEPAMWGTAIVGFGSYHYKYDSGREGDSCSAGLAARANGIVLYFADDDERESLLKKFGKYKMQGGCIYIQKFEDVDPAILVKMAKNSIKYYSKKYPAKK